MIAQTLIAAGIVAAAAFWLVSRYARKTPAAKAPACAGCGTSDGSPCDACPSRLEIKR